MPTAAMIKHYGDIRVASNVYTHNYNYHVRNLIFSRHPALYVKRRAK